MTERFLYLFWFLFWSRNLVFWTRNFNFLQESFLRNDRAIFVSFLVPFFGPGILFFSPGIIIFPEDSQDSQESQDSQDSQDSQEESQESQESQFFSQHHFPQKIFSPNHFFTKKTCSLRKKTYFRKNLCFAKHYNKTTCQKNGETFWGNTFF